MTKIGIIGLGTVGKPLYETFKYYYGSDVYGYDVNKESDEWNDIISCDYVFICVPTDGGSDGRLDMSVVKSVLDKLNLGYKGVVVIKSTLRLGWISSVKHNYSFQIVVFPEWLRAKHAFPDTVDPEVIVIGADDCNCGQAINVLQLCCWLKNEKTKGAVVDLEEAVMIKLTANALASTKISFANQIKVICDNYNINAHVVMERLREQDPRCSPRYLEPSGEKFGGYCLPKDTKELAFSIDDMSKTCVLHAVLELNDMMN